MNRYATMMLLLCALAVAAPRPALADPSRLSKSYDLLLGDVVAQRVTALLAMNPVMADVPVLTVYDRENKLLVLTIAGGRSEVEQAKNALEKLSKMLNGEVLPVIKKSFATDLTDEDFTLIYVNKKVGREVVRREGGKYLVR